MLNGKPISGAVAALALFLTFPAPARAQSSAVNATIEGVILDSTGGAVPGVAVTLTNTGTGASRTVTSNDTGFYRAQLLPLGTYRLDAEIPGFTRFSRDGIVLTAGSTARVTVTDWIVVPP